MMHDTFPDGSKVVKTASTLKEAASTVKQDNAFTFDFTGCSVKMVVDEAVRSMIVTLQNRIRTGLKSKTGVSPVPAGDVTIKVSDMLTGRGRAIVATPETARAFLNALDPATRKAIVEAEMARLNVEQPEQDE